MSSIGSKIIVVLAGLSLAGCMQATSTTYEKSPEASLKPRDKELLAKARYDKVEVAAPFRRAIVSYHRKESPGSIVVDSDNHYLYYVMEGGKAIRYGITVGEEALAFSGIARVGNMQEWPKWTPTADIHKRIEGLPQSVPGGPDNPLGHFCLGRGRPVRGWNARDRLFERDSHYCDQFTAEMFGWNPRCVVCHDASLLDARMS